MKKIFFLLLAVMPLMAFSQKAKIEFEETSYNFGTIGENNGKATHEFKFKNTGTSPLILTNVRAGCGCTTPEWSRQPLAAGESGSIKVSFDPRNRPGSFVKSITVNSNAETPVISLTIRGNVSRKAAGPYDNFRFDVGKVKLTSNSVNLGGILNTLQPERTIEMINTGDKPATITFTTESPAVTVTAEPATLQKEQKGKITVLYDAAKKNDWGFVTDPVIIKVNDNASSTLMVTANISEDFSHYQGDFEKAPVAAFSETETELRDLPPHSTQKHDIYIRNNGKEELIIRKIKTSDNDVSVHLTQKNIKPGKKTKATISMKTGDPTKRLIKLVQFTVNDPKQPMISYRISANVK